MPTSEGYYTLEEYLALEWADKWKNEYPNGHIHEMPRFMIGSSSRGVKATYKRKRYANPLQGFTGSENTLDSDAIPIRPLLGPLSLYHANHSPLTEGVI